MTTDLRIAFLGTGLISSKCLQHALEAEGCTVSHVASRDRTRAEAYIKEHRIDAVAVTYEEVADSDCDAAYVTLPNSLHVGWSEKLLSAGKHVLCEKPITPWRDELERLLALAGEQNLVWQEAFMYPHHPQTDKLVEIVRTAMHDPANSIIGELRMIRADAISNLGDGPHVEHRLRHTMQGGAMADVGVYPLGIARYLTGEELGHFKVTAAPARMPEGEQHPVDGRLFLSGVFPSGVMVQVGTSIDTWGGHKLDLVGTTGRVTTGFPYWPDAERAVLLWHKGYTETEEIVIENGGDRIEHQFRHFAQACRGNGPIIPGHEWSLGMAGALEKIWEELAKDGWEKPVRSQGV
ncbi:MAG: Gfo/Idh/MocA family oxidoreductase [Planctomycetota bacterium]